MRERAKEGMTLATTEGFPFWETWETILHGWALTQLGQEEEGIRQIRQALAVYPAVEFRTWNLALLAEAYGKTGSIDEELQVLTEALAMAEQTGERFYAQLLHHPYQEFHVLTLVSGGAEPAPAMAEAEPHSHPLQIRQGLSDAGEVLDAQAKAAYKRRLQELREELTEAQTFHDVGRTEKIQEEIDFLTTEISRAVGLGGRTRKAAAPAERAWVNVTLAIKTALKRITTHHPTLGQYLTRTIKTGYACLYAPEPHQPVVWQF